MIGEIIVPEQLRGPWEHAVVLTYGADFTFFEHAIWRQLGEACRNRIVLADGLEFVEACETAARSGTVSGLNQRYLGAGLFGCRRMHAKLILLAHRERGRLLVGSGNLGRSGYTGGGEIFAVYEYADDEPDALGDFLVARDVLDWAATVAVPAVSRHLDYLREDVPWLSRRAPGIKTNLYHNLTRSFLHHLRDAVGEAPIDELLVLAPFYDSEVAALRTLIQSLRPRRTTVLVQPDRTVIDPAALAGLTKEFGDHLVVCPFRKGERNPYIHAKLYLCVRGNQAVCLHGSPNCSVSALLRTVPEGNLEVASLVSAPRDAFASIWDALRIDPPLVQPEHFSARPLSEEKRESTEECLLIGGEWYGEVLHLFVRGDTPDLSGVGLFIKGHPVPFTRIHRQANDIEIGLTPEAISALSETTLVSLVWPDGRVSNRVFACNRVALEKTLREVVRNDRDLEKVGPLTLDDEDLEALLRELDETLTIDRHSVWRIVGNRSAIPPANDEEDERLHLSYADIDYDALRRHPKIQQYRRARLRDAYQPRSALQIILSSIGVHLRGLAPTSLPPREPPSNDGDESAEREETEAERDRHRRSVLQRNRRLLQGFVRRYLRGIRSPDFLDAVGPYVAVTNYVIFTHILWHLFFREWLDPDFLLDSDLQVLGWFWGDSKKEGYFQSLAAEDRSHTDAILRDHEHNGIGISLAILYYASQVTRQPQFIPRRLHWRQLLRSLLRNPDFTIDEEALHQAWDRVARRLPYHPPMPSGIVRELAALARFETEDSFLRDLEDRLHYPPFSCRFSAQMVMRDGERTKVDCLLIKSPDALASIDEAVIVIRAWMQYEYRGFYRVQTDVPVSSQRICFYDENVGSGVYWARDISPAVEDIARIEPEMMSWDQAIRSLMSLASQIERARHASRIG